MPTEQLPFLDLGPIMDQLDGPAGEAVREGIERPLPNFDLGMGQWLDVPQASGGGWLWVLDIKLPGSFGVKPHFRDFNMPSGAQVLVYDPNIPDNLPDPYTDRGRKDLGEFWGWTCWSEVCRIEVYFPPETGEARFANNFTIDKVAHIYRNPVTGGIGYFTTRELPCHLDRTCYSNWWTVSDSVGRMQFPTTPGFVGNCSGAMLNHTGDLAPFFLTARHCMQDITSRLDNLEVYWFYQSSTCGGAPPPIGSVPRSVGSSYVLTTNVNDMSLVMIEGTVPRNLWWSGVAYIDHVPEDWNIVGIHHPRGTYKRISFGDIWDEYDTCSSTNLTQGAEIDWDAGLIEPGSSGSPLFLLDGRVVGVCSCNELPHDCSQDSSYYGRWGSYTSTYPNVMTSTAWDDGFEDNDTCGAATNLNVYFNGTFGSRIVKVNDEDWYRITVPALGTVTYRTGFTHANGDIDMRLHDGCGAQLAASAGTGNTETITWNNPSNFAREVYLRVYLFNDTRNIYYLEFSRYGPSVPSNNTCSSPVPISVGGDYFGTTNAATNNGQASCGSSNSSPDVYYTLVSPCSQDVTIDTFGSAYDTVLSVTYLICGSSNPAVEFACNDDAFVGTLQSRVTFPANAGTTYYVRVSGYNGAFGNFNLHVRGSSPGNDNCANAYYLNSIGGTVHWTNCSATTDGPPDDACLAFGSNQIYKDLWYFYTPPCDGTINLHTFGSNFDTKIAVYANPDNSLCPPGPNSAIACNDDVNAQYESQVIFNVVGGQTYIYRVGSYAPNASTNQGRLTATFTQAVYPDDTCAGATPVEPGSYAWYTCAYQTEGYSEICGGQLYNDRWFSYTPTCDGTLDFNTLGSGVDTRIAIYSACPTGSNQALDCNDDYSPGASQESQLFTQVTPNSTYLLRVGNWAQNASLGLSMNLVFTPGGGCDSTCDSIDFNGDGLFPDTLDVDDFLSVFGGGPCSNDPFCGDIDFNNDGLFPDTLDIDSLLSVFSGGACF